ncbi:hypothetical protein VSR68_37895 [Paraburkholderia phymatum]|uniref:helix-turn-helix transcriptional regulator n=1 Tax=Paraburkholderia phymatum TaxID=148447 RepID=UPI00317ACDE2
MAITINRPAIISPAKKSYPGNTKPRSVQGMLLDDDRTWLRAGHVLTLLGISSPTLYRRINSGKFPPPDEMRGKHPYWRVGTVRPYIKSEVESEIVGGSQGAINHDQETI